MVPRESQGQQVFRQLHIPHKRIYQRFHVNPSIATLASIGVQKHEQLCSASILRPQQQSKPGHFHVEAQGI